MKKVPDTKATVAKFLDQLVSKAAQSPEDVPNVYRDVCLALLEAMGPAGMKKAVEQLAQLYNQNVPEIKLPGWEKDGEIPF